MNIHKPAIVAATALALSGCAGPLHAGQKTYQPYGLFNEDTRKVPGVKYELSAGSVIVAIILAETIVVPVYVVGWDLYEPVAEQ